MRRRWTLDICLRGEARIGDSPVVYHAGYADLNAATVAARKLLRSDGTDVLAATRAEVMTPGQHGARRSAWRGERAGYFGPEGSRWSRATEPCRCELVGPAPERSIPSDTGESR